MTSSLFFSQLEFAYPEWLWLLPILVGLGLLLRHFGKADENNDLTSTYSRLHALHPLLALLPKPIQHTRKRSSLRILGYGLVLGCLVIALAQPVRIGEKLPDPPRERDIVFIIDTGVSMILRDYIFEGDRVARITVLKGLLDKFVQALQDERIAIIVFGESPYTFVPLTRDHDLVRRMLSRIEPTMAGRFNAVGDAIALAVNAAQQESGRQRTLVLFSDASQASGSIAPETAADLAATFGLSIYTVAIGAGNYAAQEQDRLTGLIYHPVDLALLESIAKRTGARSFKASDTLALQQAISDIAQLDASTVDLPPQYFREDLYQWPLLAGLLLLSLMQFSGMLWRRRK